MSTGYEYGDDGLRVGVETTETGLRLRIASTDGALGAVVELSVPLAERLGMGISSALTRRGDR